MTISAKKMPVMVSAATAGLLLGLVSLGPAVANVVAGGDGPIACQDFQRGPNGTWTVLRPTMISPSGVMMNLTPGQTFAKNESFRGIEVTTVLDRNCGNQ